MGYCIISPASYDIFWRRDKTRRSMATHGTLLPFNSAVESWVSYSERLHHYFVANDIVSADKKRSIFLSICGPTTYDLLKSLTHPDSATDKTLDEIIEILKEHYDPTPSPIVQRFKFHTRKRKEGETVAEYVATLRSIGEHCDFGNRDRLVCGVGDKRIQRRLLQEKELTYKRAYEGMETAVKDVQNLQQFQPTQSQQVKRVQHVQKQARASTYISCYRCGGNHSSKSCRFRSATCHACNKTGHIAKACKSKTTNRQSPRKPFRKEEKKQSETVDKMTLTPETTSE